MPAKLLEEMSWEQVEAYLEHDDRLIFAVGSTEQHGRHLTFATDAMIPYAIGLRVSEATDVVLAPPLNYGMSIHHLEFPGSLSLRAQTLTQVMIDLLDSAAHHGFRRILVLNGHGGNIPALTVAAADVSNRIRGMEVSLNAWWTMPAIVEMSEKLWPGENDGHAGPSETSVFLALRPDVAKMDRVAHSGTVPGRLSRFNFRELYPHGVIGSDPKLGSAEIGQAMLEAATEACAAQLKAWGPRPGQPLDLFSSP
jgi:creatinine amidohydrolase